MMRYLSLFSGMEAAGLAWKPLGWQCAGVAEIEPNACAVLRHRYPDVPNLGSVTDITARAVRKLGRIDVVIGGSPCQDLSVAGKRAGLAGERSGLFHEQVRIFDAARTLCGARWLVWENVPGAFSSNAGRDFAVVVGTLAGCELDVPGDGWGNEGVALGDNGLVEWAVLDAQWFGVAQRRRRVFAVLDTGNWTDRSPVLLERDSLRGDFAPRREAGERPAGTIEARLGRSGVSADFAASGGLIPSVSPAVTSKWAKGSGGPAGDEVQSLVPVTTHTLRADGFDASDPARGLGADVAPTLRAMQNDGSHANAGGQVAVAFAHQGGGVQTTLGYDPEAGTSPTLASCQTPAVHVGMQVRRLTPEECETLQGSPRGWTLVPNAKGKPMADGPRYKMLGNSFAVPCIAWIGRQIQRATCEARERLAA